MTDDPPDLPDRRAFAAELTAVRERAGLTIREVAAKLDVPVATLGGYFGGTHLPPLRQPSVLAAILGVCGVSEPAAVRHWEAALRRLRRMPGPRPTGTPAPYRGLTSFAPDDACTVRSYATFPARLSRPRRLPEAMMCFMPLPRPERPCRLGEQQRHPLEHVAVELGEAAGGVAVAVVLAPPSKELVEVFDQ